MTTGIRVSSSMYWVRRGWGFGEEGSRERWEFDEKVLGDLVLFGWGRTISIWFGR